MSNVRVVAPPTSRVKLRELANQIRSATGQTTTLYFPIVSLVEFFLDRLVPGYNFHISSKAELGDNHGLTMIQDRELIIRQDVYEGAVAGVGRDRFTIAHELAHALLHSDVSLARQSPSVQLKTYNDPEWQANCFAGELLTPLSLIRECNSNTPHQVANKFGVSVQAARVALKIANK